MRPSAVVAVLHELKAYVQQLCDGNRAQAETIITSASMSVKKAAVRVHHDFVAKPGPVSGSVHLVAKAASHHASYDWQWSVDSGKTWQAAPSTLQAKTNLLGLPPATSCLFRYRAVIKTGAGDWSQVITLLVK